MQRERVGEGDRKIEKIQREGQKKNTDNEERRTYFRSHARERSFTKTTFEKEKNNI